MTVFDKFHELKDALQGDSGSSGDQKDEQKEGWSDKVTICVSLDAYLITDVCEMPNSFVKPWMVGRPRRNERKRRTV